jgi:hypothetical protein
MRAHTGFFSQNGDRFKGKFVCNFLFRNSARIISHPAFIGNDSTEVGADVRIKRRL